MPKSLPNRNEKLSRSSKSLRVERILTSACETLEPRTLFSTFQVTSLANAGAGTLRQAILDANANVGPDAIRFAITDGSSTVKRIIPTTLLPTITGTIDLDATSQPGYAGAPVVELIAPGFATRSTSPGSGIAVTASNSIIRGIAVEGFTINVSFSGSGNTLASSFVGVTASGTDLFQEGVTTNFQIPLVKGVEMYGDGHTIGGSTPTAWNVISGNRLGIATYANEYIIQGNLIGTDPTGTAARPNYLGILPAGDNGLIGGSLAEARNVISGNQSAGISLGTGSAVGLRIQGNYIGTTINGRASLDNSIGISLGSGSQSQIGGPLPGQGNLISGNSRYGIEIEYVEDSSIQGNTIGLAADGSPLGNGVAGIKLAGANNIQVGGAGSAANTIAYSGTAGIAFTQYMDAPFSIDIERSSLSQNRIYSPTGIGIDLEDDGVSGRDLLDTDDGPNGMQNAPLIQSVTGTTGALIASTILDSKPSTTYRIEWFASNPAITGTRPHGQVYLTSADITTNSAGFGSIDQSLLNVPSGWAITATATSTEGDTSEFSNALVKDAPAPPPVLWSPSNPNLEAASDNGKSQTDNVTNDNTPTFAGIAPANSTVELFIEGVRRGSTTVTADGIYRITATGPIADGSRLKVRAVTVGANGERSPVSATSYITIDTVSPEADLSLRGRSNNRTPVSSVYAQFRVSVSEPTPGLAQLLRDGVDVFGPGYTSLTYNGFALEFKDLTTLTTPAGAYELVLPAGIVTDIAGNPSVKASIKFDVISDRTVSVLARPDRANELNQTPGAFVFTRTGSLSESLTVNLTYSGTATSDVDYEPLPSTVTFAANSSTASISVTPLNDLVYDPEETVVATIASGGAAYSIGSSNSATVRISDAVQPVSFTFDPTPASQVNPIQTITLRASRPVTGLTLSDLALRRDLGAALAWGTEPSLTSADGVVWQLSGLATLTQTPGVYRVDFTASATVNDSAGGVEVPATSNYAAIEILPKTVAAFVGMPVSAIDSPIDRVTVSFTREVAGVDISDFELTRNGGANLLTATQTVGASGAQINIANLTSLTYFPGNYRLVLKAASSGITDSYDGPLQGDAEASWTVVAPPPPVPTNVNRLSRALADTYARDGSYAGRNFGLQTEMQVKKSGAGYSREAFFKFDLGTTPGAVSSAQLRVFARTSEAGAISIQLDGVANTWSETALNWNTRPSITKAAIRSASVGGTTGTWLQFDVSSFVAQARAAGATSVAFAIRATSTSNGFVILASDESANRPELKWVQSSQPSLVLASNSLAVGEGQSKSVGVSLSAAPAGNVYVQANRSAGDSDLTTSTGLLVFTPDNWSVPQTVIVNAAADADALNGSATFAVAANGYATVSFKASEIDDDVVVVPPPPPRSIAKFNFQPTTAPAVSGYLVDSGLTYAARNGKTYGWSTSHADVVSDRGVNANQLLDTSLRVKAGGKWELAVANGTYTVKLTVGDAAATSKNNVWIEGVQLFNNQSQAANVFSTKSITVNVTDGRLTLGIGSIGGGLTKLDYIEVS